MSKLLCLAVLLVVFVTAHGYHENGKFDRYKRMNSRDELLQEEEANEIDHGKNSGSKHSLYQGEVEGESVYPKKVAHKKKGNKKHNVNLDSFEDQHSKTLGHRGEQKWRVVDGEKKKKKNKKRINSDEDLHLQDLEYSGKKNLDQDKKIQLQEENVDKDSYRKKHNKDKKKEKKEKKEKKMNKEKEQKKKQKNERKEKKDKENRNKNKKLNNLSEP